MGLKKQVEEQPSWKKKKKKEKRVKYFDFSLLFVVMFLLAFGLIMVYSTSAYMAGIKLGQQNYYFKRQIMTSCIGLACMFGASLFDYHNYKKFVGLIYFVPLACCALVPFIGTEYNGSKRWLAIGPISFQPSELAKLAVLIIMALLAARATKRLNNFWGLLTCFLTISPFLGAVVISNLSNAIIIAAIALSILFVASKRYVHFVAMGFMGVGVIAAYIALVSYRASRISAWLNPESSPKGYQTLQGLYAIGSGGLFGKGLGQSVQKLGYVPEAQNDMIFSIICEELGLFGAVFVISLFLIMIWRFVVIANRAKDLLGSLLVVGVLGHIATQVILNIAVVTNTIPNTGISLPFISYGGTSVIFLLTEIGIVLNVSRGIRLEE